MNKLLTTTALSLLLISTASVSYGQAAICSPRTLIGGGGGIWTPVRQFAA